MRIVTDDFAALCANEPELADLRASVRDFLVADRVEFGWTPSVDAWLSSWDEEFSARLGDAGFLGLTIPREYGGQGLSHLHRYVVTEELLVEAHEKPDQPWITSLFFAGFMGVLLLDQTIG